MSLLMVQQILRPSASPRPPIGSTGDAGSILAVLVLLVVVMGAWLLVSDLRERREAAAATLVEEAERWLGERHPDV
jgi:hypothetical protein